jgi:hypothetical protein
MLEEKLSDFYYCDVSLGFSYITLFILKFSVISLPFPTYGHLAIRRVAEFN